MNRIATCPACTALKNGVKSRIALEHTCGLEPGNIPSMDDNITFQTPAMSQKEREETLKAFGQAKHRKEISRQKETLKALKQTILTYMNFSIEALSTRNHRITMIEQQETSIIQYVVDLFYLDIYIGYAFGVVSEDCSLNLIDEYQFLQLQMYEWRGKEYSTEVLSKKNDAGELILVEGEFITDTEDIHIWLEGKVADWIKNNFYFIDQNNKEPEDTKPVSVMHDSSAKGDGRDE